MLSRRLDHWVGKGCTKKGSRYPDVRRSKKGDQKNKGMMVDIGVNTINYAGFPLQGSEKVA
jgi:hypothetical protein